MRLQAILTAGLTLISLSASGQSLQHVWTPDARVGCRVWSANPDPSGAVTWSGACQNSSDEEPGALQWFRNETPAENGAAQPQDNAIGSHVVATLVMSGRGVATWANGDRYDGEWRDGNMNGYGVAMWANGDRYDGEWRDSRKDGQGTQVDSNGSRYDGEWRDDLPNGMGTMVLSNGDSFSGVWVNGCYRNGNRRALFGVDQSACQ